MSRARRLAPPILTAASAALCAASIVLWTCSHYWPWRISFHTSQARYTLHSSDGDLVFAAPPPASEADSPAIEAIAREMSADDLEPRRPTFLPRFYFPRPGSPTGLLVDRSMK